MRPIEQWLKPQESEKQARSSHCETDATKQVHEEIRVTQARVYSLRPRHKRFAQIHIPMKGPGQSGQKEGICGRVDPESA